ncbi:MAG: hypothetical protein R3C32_00225 [Chloroflexota bacterium]
MGAAAVLVTAAPAVAQSPAPAMSMDELVAAAQAEGTLNVIALPRDWCNYGAAIDGFKASTAWPSTRSTQRRLGDEVQAIIANKDSGGDAAPDVDVGLSFGPDMVAQGCSRPTRSAPGTRSGRRQGP